MKTKTKKYLIIFIALFFISLIFTILVKVVDVKAIGPNSSSVGFSTMNQFVHNLTGVHYQIYTLTDIMGWLAFILLGIFALMGLIQWIKRKNLLKVDKNILALGIFYIITLALFLFFEFVVINRRPVLIEGKLESSYPSSTTMLALTILISTIFQVKIYVKNQINRIISYGFCGIYSAFLIIARIISGVHWFSDILGAIIISTTLIMLYVFLNSLFNDLDNKETNNI